MAVKITAASLRAIAPGAAPDIVAGIVEHQAYLAQYGIDTPRRVSHFLGQCATETAGFTRLEENLYYTTAARLKAVWPSRFPTPASAAPYLRNPQALANKVYGGRLGNTGPNDGWLHRGSGCKQTTGKANYQAVEKDTGLPVVSKPEMLRRFPEALQSACIYWRDNRLNRFADGDDIVALTKAIQGGSGGLADRRIYTDRAKRVAWAVDGTVMPAPSPKPSRGPLLRIGARGEAVTDAQQLLAAHGYEVLVDGKFGQGTDNIVRAFQEDRGMMADGVIGSATWTALRAEPAPQQAAPPETADPLKGWAAIVQAIIKLFRRQS